MKNKRLVSFAVALVFILSCGFSAFALGAPTLSDWIAAFAGDLNYDKYTTFTSQEWSSLSVEERRQNFEYVITDLGGTSHITDDFLSSDLSFERYNDLVGNSLDLNSSLIAQARLEFDGYADFNLGWYDGFHDGGHSSGKFGDGTVADTLNDEFLDYIHNNSYPSSDIHKIKSGDYTFIYGVDFLIDGSIYLVPAYVDIFCKGEQIFTNKSGYDHSYVLYCYSANGVGIDYYDKEARDAFNELSAHLYYDSSSKCVIYFGRFGEYICDLSPYISDDVDLLPDTPLGLATDDNGNQIELNIDSDGVTYEGNTYNYNNDNTVTINGDTYHITVDPSTIDENYYNQFLGDTINNYYNYYNTTETPFDDTDILTALKSIFTSLESFRSSCYTQFKQLYDSVRSIPSSITKLGKKLDTIIEQLKKLNKEVEQLTEEEEENNKLAWLNLVTKFKNKVGWSALETSMNNISVAFFGTRSYSFSSSGDINVTITSSGGSVSSSSMPSLSVTILGCKYDLYTCLGSLGSGIDTIKSFISLFLWIGFIVSVFRSIPSIIGGVSSVQDHSNNVVIDKRTGEVKRGA